MHHRARLAITAAAAALAIAVIASVEYERAAQVDIATAIQSHDASRSASRNTEAVRYDDIDVELVATYLLDSGRLGGTDEVPAEHRAAWMQVERVLPAAAVAEIRQLNIVTDGLNGTLAMVHRSGIADDHWILTLDVAEPADVLAVTLVHEYAHMLTLRRDQLSTASGACDGVVLDIGCATTGSPLSDWAEQFWPGVAEPATYDRHAYVSDYAASSVHEDLAESFLAYVTGDPEMDGSALAAKRQFFETRPQFASAATELRNRLQAA
jgi:hypothetical protein